MWALIKLGLRYHRPPMAIGAVVSVAIAGLISLLARQGMRVEVHGVHGLDLTQVWVLGLIVAQTLPVAAMITGFIMTGLEREERRLHLLATLPVTRRQVSAFRALLPLLPILGAAAVSAVILGALSLLARIGTGGLLGALAMITVPQLLFLVQIPLTVRDIIERRESGRWRQSMAIALLLLTLAGIAWWATFQVQVMWVRLALPAVAAAVLVLVNIRLFERRRSFC